MRLSYSLMIAMGCALLGQAAVIRSIPLEVSNLNGCYVEQGSIKLHRELPRQDGENDLVLSCAKPLHIFFQEDVFARKAGARSDELVQIKKSASEYGPQHDDAEASAGYIDYTKLAVYQYHITTPGRYAVWYRVWVPSVANWQFTAQYDKGAKLDVNLKLDIPAAHQWFWKRGDELELSEGNHQLEIANALNGKRISEILLTRNLTFVPKGEQKVTPARNITSGTVDFCVLEPYGLEKWKSLSGFDFSREDAHLDLSVDGGKSYVTLRETSLEKYGKCSLRFRLSLARQEETEPVVKGLLATYECDADKFVAIQAGDANYTFSRKNGALAGIVNSRSRTVIQPEGHENSLFNLLLKVPGKASKRYLDMQDAKFEGMKLTGKDALQLCWRFSAENIRVMLEIKAESDLLIWNLTVENGSSTEDVIEVEGPVISELRIGANPADDTLIWPFSAGEFIPSPAEKGEFSIHYPDHAGMPFAILTNGKESFYYACHDKKALITRFTSAANSASDHIALKICRKHRIAMGSKRTDTFVTAVRQGTWHRCAEIYRAYFYKTYPKNTYRPWLRNSDAWLQGSAAGHTGLMKQYESYAEFHRNFKSAAFLSLDYIQMWGSIFNGACPCYYLPRKDKGGEKLFAEEMEFWRKHGGYTGHYYFANGIAPYYLLTDKYFGLSWDNYPAEYRPPSFDWYVRNREYISDNVTINEAELRKKTAQINETHAKKQIVSGNYEESATGYMPMNWRTGEYAAFLKKWINIYVSKYHCNTAYLDTFAFRNDLADFNPHLKLNGEGDKAIFKLQFLENLMADMRKIEPEFSALTEGIADIYGQHLYFLLSGFARNPNIYRYTLPDQIIFQGSCNGLWSKPLTRKSILQAFLCGNRFDLVIMYPETYYMLKLRQQISPFLNLAIFDDVCGITASSPEVTVFAHKILPEQNARIDGGQTRAITLTIGNPDGKDAKISYELPEGFTLNRAVVCEIYKDMQPLTFTQQGHKITFQAPRGSASAVILIDKVAGAHCYTVTAEQAAPHVIEAKVNNFMEKPISFNVAVGDKEEKISVASLDSKIARFEYPAGAAFDILPVRVSAHGLNETKRIISLGVTESKVPVPELPAAAASSGVIKIDFEESIYSREAAASGRRGFLLEGNGKFCMHKLPLELVANAHYELTAKLRKSPEVSMKSGDCFMMVAFYTEKEKKLVRVSMMGGAVANDNQFHNIKIEFDTPENLYKPALYLYNSNSQGKFSVDDIVITEISRFAPAATPVAPAPTTEKKQVQPQLIHLDLGETELEQEAQLKNKQVIKIQGNGKYCQKKIELKLQPNRTYRLKLMMRKGFEVSKVGHENMVAVCNYTADNKLESYLTMATSLPLDNRFHSCAGTFKTSDKLNNCGLYIYNRNSTDLVTVGDIELTDITDKK